MSYLNQILTANSQSFANHTGIGKNQARRLAEIKRQNAIRSGKEQPVAHMAGSFGYK